MSIDDYLVEVRPLLLDLFCGAGGAAVGYNRAGFDVVGVDRKLQPRYPFPFHQADALEVMPHLAGGLSVGPFLPTGRRYRLADFAAVHASPPCQAYTPLRSLHPQKDYPDLLGAVREDLAGLGLPWVIENVMAAPLRYGVVLCGGMFGLRTYRHRRFESSLLLWQPTHRPHRVRTCSKKRRSGWDAGLNISVTGDVGRYVGSAAMGIDWMTGAELSQAIPPAYTEFVGRQIRHAL